MNKPIPVEVGERYGRAVIAETGTRIIQGGALKRACVLRCDCGSVFNALVAEVVRGSVVSCGCGSGDWREFVLRKQIRAMARAAGFDVTGLGLRQRA